MGAGLRGEKNHESLCFTMWMRELATCTRPSSRLLLQRDSARVELGTVDSFKKKGDYPGAITISIRSTGSVHGKPFDETVAMATSGGSACGIIDKKPI